MQAFRAELVFNKTERVTEDEALKEEIRNLTGHLQTKFLEVEAGQQQFRLQETEALKVELRKFVAQVEARFVALEPAIGNLDRGAEAGERGDQRGDQ